MKRLISCLLLTLALSGATAQDMPSVKEVYEIYHYCLYDIEMDDDSAEYEAEILTCVNQELMNSEYPGFTSYKALMDYITDYLEGEDDSLNNAQNYGSNP